MERLYVTGYYWVILLVAALAWLIESYDIGIIGSALVPLKRLYHLGPGQVGLLAIASTVGIVVGVVPAGYLADRLGRKRMLMAGMVFYSLCTGLTGFASSWPFIALGRFVAGLGLGAVFPLPYTMLSEMSPSYMRGTAAGILDSFLSLGYFASPLLASLLIPRMDLEVGWRVLFWVGALPLVYTVVIWRLLPESPRWLEVKGRHAEAEAVLRRIEARIERSAGKPLPSVERRRAVKVVKDQVPVAELWSGPFLRRTLMIWTTFGGVFFIFYAITSFMPTVLTKEGFGLAASFGFTALIQGAAIPGKWLEAWVVERWGRRPTIAAFTLVAAACAAVFGWLKTVPAIVAVAVVMSFFGIAADPAVKVYAAEQYPTRIRGVGTAFTEGVGRLIGGALAPYLFALILGGMGVAGSFWLVAGVALVAVVVVWAFGRETRGELLEQAAEA
ncbi:MAG: MFS transporter [Firmicutes bacterium]|nr:MFS transporter [Alicyclobacillaceae bacterium]MCL6497536.1 MFS transporter [Bacillota bacterium]